MVSSRTNYLNEVELGPIFARCPPLASNPHTQHPPVDHHRSTQAHNTTPLWTINHTLVNIPPPSSHLGAMLLHGLCTHLGRGVELVWFPTCSATVCMCRSFSGSENRWFGTSRFNHGYEIDFFSFPSFFLGVLHFPRAKKKKRDRGQHAEKSYRFR